MTPVEKVARAIKDAVTRIDGDPVGVHLSYSIALDESDADETLAGIMSICEDAARAAIEAMREPSESMADAVRGDVARLQFDRIHDHDVARAIYTGMIDAALAGEWAHIADLDPDEVPADVAALAEGEE